MPEAVVSLPSQPAEDKVDQTNDSMTAQAEETQVEVETVVAAPSLEMEAERFL